MLIVRIVRNQSKMRHNAEINVTAGGEIIYHRKENGEQHKIMSHLTLYRRSADRFI